MLSLADTIGKIRERRRAAGLPVYDGEPLADPVAADGGDWCDLCHGARWLRRDLEVSHPEFGKLVACTACDVVTKRALERLWGDMPEHFRAFRLGTYPTCTAGQRQLVDELRAWLDGERWLYLHGEVGRGKSGLAAALVNEAVSRGQSGLFRVVPDLLDRIRRTYRNRDAFDASETDVLESLYVVDILVLDDLGSEKSSEWVGEKLFQVIGHRHDAHKRTIITSNLNLVELRDHLEHPRTPSRIAELADVFDLSNLPNLRAA